MTEFLSMTLLSAEPVSAGKTQAAVSTDGATAPDQSFAATLAAEVNGKAPEKSVKSPAKARQNTASESVDNKEISKDSSQTELKSDSQKTVTTIAEQADDAELTPEKQTGTLTAHEANEDEQSHWLQLLEKAKNLQDRLSKSGTASEFEAGKVDAGNKTATEHTEAMLDSTTGMADKTAAVADGLAAAAVQAGASKSHSGTAKVVEQASAEESPSAQTKTAGTQNTAIVLDDKLLAEQNSEQHLTAEELNALKRMTQPEKSTSKNQAIDTGLKQRAAEPNPTTEQDSSEIAEATKTVVQSQLFVHKDTGPDQNKLMAHIEKTLKVRTEITQSSDTEQQSDVGEKPLSPEAESATLLMNKTVLSAGQASVQPKGVAATTVNPQESVQTDNEAEGSAEPSATDVKTSVQTQSAAVMVAPALQQAKTVATETKVTTEEALKQTHAAAVSAQAEQGSSSAGEQSSHQGGADGQVALPEPQKSTAAVVTESGSFSHQLKSSLEKTASAITVAGREFVAEQKQVDQLGQKLNLIQPQASNQLKEQMMMMVKDKVHTAEIRLDPSELGSMQIKISLQQDQMSVQFMVQQGNAKELMEQQMPKLRELLQQQGIELSQGSVQQQNQSSSGQEGGRRTAGGHGAATETDPAEEMAGAALLSAKNSDRVVDYYA